MTNPAPDFNPGYPSTGERIGPAWRAAWLLLSDERWHSSADLRAVMMPAGPVVAGTAMNLLGQAARKKLIKARWVRATESVARHREYRKVTG